MTGTLLYLGLWGLDRTGPGLITAIADHLARSRAVLGPASTERLAVEQGQALTAFGPAQVETLPADRGGLAFVRLRAPTPDPDEQWRPLLAAVRELILAVGPTLATVAVEEPPDALPDPTWAEARTLLGAGWVDLSQLAPEQRVAFDKLRDMGIAVPLGPGLWWSAQPALSVEDEPESLPHQALAAVVYEAWTGRTAPEPDDAPRRSLPENAAQLWFWSADGDVAGLRDRVAAALPALTCWIMPGEQGWQPVIAQAGGPADLAKLLDDLRSCVPVVRASWAGLQPTGGVAVPGLDPDLPATGVVVHPWVDRHWIGADLSTLDNALAGCHREELGDGILYVTDPVLAIDVAAGWGDAGRRWDRLVQAAAILGTAAQRGPAPTGWIGDITGH